MKIAIHAADLDAERIDGTRIYIKNILNFLGKISPEDSFLIGHRRKFNPQLEPRKFSNYGFFEKDFLFSWTQTRFAYEIWKRKPDVLWMPMHNLPFLRRKNLKTVVTIHDLAFKIFPEHFTKKDLRKLNFLVDYAIRNSDRLIAVSQSTKNDILRFYPEIENRKIQVIHHGFDRNLFQRNISKEESEEFLSKFKIQNSKFILYVGALQPRKNLKVLIEAFEKIKKSNPEMKLVLAGEKAWMWEDIIRKAESSEYKEDILMVGKASFENLPILYKNAKVFVFPSLYEGFGIPVLEAFASRVPVVLAENSSLPEVGGDASLYFKAEDSSDLAEKIKKLLLDEKLCEELVAKGEKRAENFSWEKCAHETLKFLKEK